MSFETNVAHLETENGDKILFPFGPPLFQTEVDPNFTKELLEEGRKLDFKKDGWSHKLAGNLKYGKSYHYKQDYVLKAEPYLKTYAERFFNGIINQNNGSPHLVNSLLAKQIIKEGSDESHRIQGKLRLGSLWINFSQKHDYNPSHYHAGVLSFVIFVKVPPEIFTDNAISNTKQAGKIIFSYGDNISEIHGSDYVVEPYENLMFIFPAKLKHFVPPYWVDAERISVSGNFWVE